ncbi:MAG TPA: hypothetical protein VMZ27_14235 [Candidatus Saccharimonadales bacterium]|nr:hypothetical protein [Candidatus Saccharimonadales bacterium]
MKWVKRLLIVVVVLVVLVFLGAFLFLDSIVKRGVEKVGPAITKTDVKLGSAHISPFSGSGELKKFVIGNPEGYKSPSAMSVGVAGVSVVPKSVMGDKVVIRYVKVVSPEINFEGSPLGENNLSKLLANVQGTEKKQPETKEEAKSKTKKLQVDDFLITGAKVNVNASVLGKQQAMNLTIPEIHLTNLGQGPEGITPAELMSKVLSEVTAKTLAAVTASAGNIGKEVLGGVTTNATETLQKGVKDFFKKK